jgi:hypothetical protein
MMLLAGASPEGRALLEERSGVQAFSNRLDVLSRRGWLSTSCDLGSRGLGHRKQKLVQAEEILPPLTEGT